ILSGLLALPEDVERFHAEAEAAANLDHPGIVPIFEVGEHEGQHYFSMGYVEGRSLSALVPEGPQPALEAARIVRTVCDAVQYAHEHQIIHRDLKPANILLDRDGRPRVTDFGLAKHQQDDSGRTATGQVLGTPAYMPPEQAVGNLNLIGPAADVYALGAILYTLLTGRPPFQSASSVDTLRQVLEKEPLAPSELTAGVPRDLETIVLKCLQKPIAQRYASARELADDLQRFLDGRPILARPVGRVERGWRWCRRNPLSALLSSAVVLLLAAVAIISTAAALEYRSQFTRATVAENAEKDAKQDALAKLWDSYVVAARAGRMSKRPGQRFGSLLAIEKALALPMPPGRSKDELRTEAIAAMLLADLEAAKELPGLQHGTTAVAIDQTFQRYARGDADGKVSVRRVSDDAELFQLPGDGPLSDYGGLAFSPDGRFLMQGCETLHSLRRRVWKLDGSQPAVAVSCSGPSAFSPDSRQLAAGYADGSIRLYDLETSRELKRYEPAGFVPLWLDWNPRRHVLAAFDGQGTSYRLLDLTTGKLAMSVPVNERISFTNWHPEGRLLAVSDQDAHPKITLWDTLTGQLTMPPMESHRTQGVLVRFNHAGDRLLSTDWSGLWRLWDTHTGQLLLTQPAGGVELCFSPDDNLVGLDATAQGLRMFRFQSGREFSTIVHRVNSVATGYTGDDVGNCQLDHDGRLLAIPARDGVVVVDAVRGEEVALLRLGDNAPIGLEPSGALLTHGSAGVLRWPLADDGAPSRRVYGPPQKLVPTMAKWPPGGVGESADGRVLAFPASHLGARGLILPEGKEFQLTPQEDVRHCAVSPDGHWAVTGSHGAIKGPAAKIWDTRTGRHVRDLPVTDYCFVSFSPDGKWLLTTGGGARLWSVGTWNEGPKLGNSALRGAFSADGALLALQDEPGVVRLVVPDTGKEVARLTAPETIRLNPICFTRDGRRLVCRVEEGESLSIFDLGLIRAQLAAMGLDWDAPSFPIGGDATPSPLTVRVVGADKLSAP
ncbi:MAG TPA: WD40 repeat domain-containing serine/threonine-protein kinase, partial [Pirellulales bacterium]|nr:WD40 repeat domain-containing serine/threonine-protein kinase [Pirellulales bacterium]